MKDFGEVLGKAGRATRELLGNVLPVYVGLFLLLFFSGALFYPFFVGFALILALVGGLVLSAVESWVIEQLVRPESYVARLLDIKIPKTLSDARVDQKAFLEAFSDDFVPRAKEGAKDLWIHRHQLKPHVADALNLAEGRILCFTYLSIICAIGAVWGVFAAWCSVTGFYFSWAFYWFWSPYGDVLLLLAALVLMLAATLFFAGSRWEISNYRRLLSEYVPIVRTLLWSERIPSSVEHIKRQLQALQRLKKERAASAAAISKEEVRLKKSLQKAEGASLKKSILVWEFVQRLVPDTHSHLAQSVAIELRQLIDEKRKESLRERRRMILMVGISFGLYSVMFWSGSFTSPTRELFNLLGFGSLGIAIVSFVISAYYEIRSRLKNRRATRQSRREPNGTMTRTPATTRRRDKGSGRRSARKKT